MRAACAPYALFIESRAHGTLPCMPSNPQRLASLYVASRSLGLPANWLREEALAGRIPCLRAGDRLLFDLETLRQLVNELAKTGADPKEARNAF